MGGGDGESSGRAEQGQNGEGTQGEHHRQLPLPSGHSIAGSHWPPTAGSAAPSVVTASLSPHACDPPPRFSPPRPAQIPAGATGDGEPRPREGFGKFAGPTWPKPRGPASPNRGGGSQRRGNGGGVPGGSSSQNNGFRPRRDGYGGGNAYRPNQYHVRQQRPVFPPPMPFYPPPQMAGYPGVPGYGEYPLQMLYLPIPSVPYPKYVVNSPPGLFVSPTDLLRSAVLNQIDYYFSEDNLCKDTYLRRHMDDDGWVPVSVIALFKKMIDLNTTIPFILDTMRKSNVVELKGNLMRPKVDPTRWPLRFDPMNPPPTGNSLVPQMNAMALAEGSGGQINSASS